MELKPDFAAAQANLGVALLRQGQVVQAIEALERLRDLTRNNADIFYTWVLAYARVNRNGEAIKQLRNAIAINPEHTKASSNWNHLSNAGTQTEGRVKRFAWFSRC